jgi:hypothetical protein
MTRHIRLEDAEAFLTYFRRLTADDPERVERPQDVATISLEIERAWIQSRIDAETKQEMIVRCVESGGKIVALGEMERLKRWIERHVAEIRFGLLPGHQADGRELVAELEAGARKSGIEVLVYFHLASQVTGLDVMRSLGYQEVGRIPNFYKRETKYIDRVYLSKQL